MRSSSRATPGHAQCLLYCLLLSHKLDWSTRPPSPPLPLNSSGPHAREAVPYFPKPCKGAGARCCSLPLGAPLPLTSCTLLWLAHFLLITKAVGSRPLGDRVRRLKPDLHVFGKRSGGAHCRAIACVLHTRLWRCARPPGGCRGGSSVLATHCARRWEVFPSYHFPASANQLLNLCMPTQATPILPGTRIQRRASAACRRPFATRESELAGLWLPRSMGCFCHSVRCCWGAEVCTVKPFESTATTLIPAGCARCGWSPQAVSPAAGKQHLQRLACCCLSWFTRHASPSTAPSRPPLQPNSRHSKLSPFRACW